MTPATTHVIFDLDGLLLNTEVLHAGVIQEIAARYGKFYTPEAKAQVVGRRSLESSQALVNALELPLSAEACRAERHRMMRDRYAQAELMPGVDRLTRALKARGIPMAIATSSHEEHFRLKSRHHGLWLEQFSTIVKGDDPDLQRGKPAPDIFLLAAQRLGARPEQCLVFEDSPAGVSAAIEAGMRVVAIPDPELDFALFQAAHQVLPSLEAFMLEQWDLAAPAPYFG